MKVVELNIDGTLTRESIQIIGNEYNTNERLALKIYGLGHLRFNSIPECVASRVNSGRIQKLHFDWTSRGAVLRIRSLDKLLGLLIADDEVLKITIIKKPDHVYAFPFFPFWILLKLKVPFRIARWFMINRGFDELRKGNCVIAISVIGSKPLILETEAWFWPACVSTFIHSKANGKSEIKDLRTWVTKNGIPFK